MLKMYNVQFSQGDIEYIDDLLVQSLEKHPELFLDIAEMRQTLNNALPCNVMECENARRIGSDLCVEHAAEREDARATRPRYVTDYETDMREAGRGHLLR